MRYIQVVLMTVLPYLSHIVAFFHMLPPKFANIQYVGQTGLGPLTGESRFHMSILRNVNVALSNLRNGHVTLSNLRNGHVPCHYDISSNPMSHVTRPKPQKGPCRRVDFKGAVSRRTSVNLDTL